MRTASRQSRPHDMFPPDVVVQGAEFTPPPPVVYFAHKSISQVRPSIDSRSLMPQLMEAVGQMSERTAVAWHHALANP